jgi:hypothetical protein
LRISDFGLRIGQARFGNEFGLPTPVLQIRNPHSAIRNRMVAFDA